MMGKIAIIGVGLIGGSLAKAFKVAYGHQVTITGFDMNEKQLALAKSLGVIDQPEKDLEQAIAGARFIFICTPVQDLAQLAVQILTSPDVEAETIVTDVGSTKLEIHQLVSGLGQAMRCQYIGGHPMAGSHKSGVEAANERLFENAYYVLTPHEAVGDQKAYQHAMISLKQLLQATRAKVVELSPKQHDQVVAAISHFPHVVASALVEQVFIQGEENPWYFQLAAGGFRDITRIASSNPRMWRDITLSNSIFILEQIELWQKQMESIANLIRRGAAEEVEAFFNHAKQVRDGLPEKKSGAIPSYFDLYVDIPDQPGIIGKVTTLLGNHQLSITNIRILETREDIMGVLRLTFRSEVDRSTAKAILEHESFPVYIGG